MSGFFSKIRLSSALKTVKNTITWLHNSQVNHSREKNPLIRMYYDSELGSPIEDVVEKAYAASAYDTLKDFVPDWKPAKQMCQSIGSWIAHKKTQALDISKVIYHISTNRISTDKAYHEIAKRTTSGIYTAASLACKAGHFVGVLTGKLGDLFLPPGTNDFIKKGFDLVVGEGLRGLRNRIFSDKSKEKVERFVEKGLRVAVTATKDIIEVADKVLQKTGQAIDRTVSFVKDFATVIGEDVKSFKNKVCNTAKTIGAATKTVAKKIWNKIKFW